MKQAITKGYKGEGLLTLTEELVENDDLLVISNTEFKWLLQQFDFSNFSRLLQAYASGNRSFRSDFTESDLGHTAIECLKNAKLFSTANGLRYSTTICLMTKYK